MRREDFSKIINAQGYQLGAEIGVQYGYYAEYLLGNTDTFMYLVDPWRHLDDYKDIANKSDDEQEKIYQFCIDYLIKTIPDYRYTILRNTSKEAIPMIQDESLDFIYIDANHDYEHTFFDVTNWYKKLRYGGLFFGHDFLEGTFDGTLVQVKSALCDFMLNKNITLRKTDDEFPSWWFIKI